MRTITLTFTLLVLMAAIPDLALAQKSNRVESGTVDAHSATWIPPSCTFASPPSSPPTGSVCIFTDASAAGTCGGSGTALSYCRYSGSGWIAIGGAGGGGGGGTYDLLRFSICIPAGCGPDQTINYAATHTSGSFSGCSINLATAATGSNVIVDVRDATGTSIFGATKLVVPISSTSVITQTTFASSPQNFTSTSKYMAIVTQVDSNSVAQGGMVQCW